MEAQTPAAAAPATRALEYLPVGLFGSVMGLSGLSNAWALAHVEFGFPEAISKWIGLIAAAAFVVLACSYLAKWVSAPDAVRAEFVHPIASSLFATILVSLLLLPIIVAPVSLMLGRLLWGIGAAGILAFAWLMVSRWLSDQQQVAHSSPAWLLPVVGVLNLPIAMPALGLEHLHGLMVLGLAIGLFFAVPLFTMIVSRLVFEPALPPALQPTLMILMAPFAVGTSTYIATTGQVDLFAESLYWLTLFMLAVLAGRLRYLARCCPFKMSWWAVSFPLAAAAIAALRIAGAEPGVVSSAIALALLALATVVILGLLARTVLGIARGELRALSS